MSQGGPGARPPLATFRTHSPWLPLFSLTRANLLLLARNRQVMVFNVLVPLLLIVIFGGLFQGGKTTVDLAAPARAAAAFRLVLAARSFDVRQVSAARARQDVVNGKADFALVVPAAEIAPLRVMVLENRSNITSNGSLTAVAESAVGVLNQELLHTAPAAIPQVDPIQPSGQARGASLANNSYIQFLTPGILAYAVLTAGLGAGIRLVGDRERGVLRRVRATPMPVWAFLGSSIISQLVLVVIQVVVLLGVGHLMYGVGLGPVPLPVLLMLLVGSLCFLAGGFLIAGVARREQAAIVMLNLISLPQLFVAGVFYPLSGAPQWLQNLSVIMPLTYFSDGLRALMAEGRSLGQVGVDLLVLVGIGLAVLVVAVRNFRFDPASAGS
ncbi:MAG: ABC transporter permease [Candidatus Dormibacteria bacterium]